MAFLWTGSQIPVYLFGMIGTPIGILCRNPNVFYRGHSTVYLSVDWGFRSLGVVCRLDSILKEIYFDKGLTCSCRYSQTCWVLLVSVHSWAHCLIYSAVAMSQSAGCLSSVSG